MGCESVRGTPDARQIYRQYADQYHQLVSREDYQGRILPALRAIRPFEGLDVLDLGAGTGRLSRLLAPVAGTLVALDASPHMLRGAAAGLRQSARRNWGLAAADHRFLPLADRVVDVVLSGWSVCYLVVWHAQTWQVELDRALAEMRRVLRPGGTIILLETLGTGFETPHPPEPLQPYYAWLERRGFSFTWIRTDYRFESLSEAVALTRFFFGRDLAEQVIREKWIVLPECTGVWWLAIE